MPAWKASTGGNLLNSQSLKRKETGPSSQAAKQPKSQKVENLPDMTKHHKSVQQKCLGPVFVPLASLIVANERRSTRPVDEKYALSMVPWLSTLTADSASISVVGFVPTLVANSADETKKAVQDGKLMVEVSDGNHRLFALKHVVAKEGSHWKDSDKIMVTLYYDVDDYEALYISRSRNMNTNVHREEDIWDLIAIFRKLIYRSMGVDQTKTINPDNGDSARANVLIAEITGISWEDVRAKYKGMSEIGKLSPTVWNVFCQFVEAAKANRINNLKTEKKATEGLGTASKIVFKNIMTREIPAKLRKLNEDDKCAALRAALPKDEENGDYLAFLNYSVKAEDIEAEEEGSIQGTNEEAGPEKNLHTEPPESDQIADTSDDLKKTILAQGQAISQYKDELKAYQTKLKLFQLQQDTVRSLVKNSYDRCYLDDNLRLYFGGTSRSGVLCTTFFGVLEQGVLVYKKQQDNVDVQMSQVYFLNKADHFNYKKAANEITITIVESVLKALLP